jgi:hypothetical protein
VGMSDEIRLLFAIGLLLIGFLLIRTRAMLSRKLADLYRKLCIDVPLELYGKQFVFVAVVVIILGFLVGTGLITFL